MKSVDHAPINGRSYMWHQWWAVLFEFLHIPRKKIFLRAYIIHYSQIIIAFLALFYFSNVLLRILFKSLSKTMQHYAAYWSVLLWFTTIATFSEYYHQVWISWYSVNYQISLPLVFALTGITMSLLFDRSTSMIKLMKVIVILFLSYIILRIHSAEFIYYLLYIGILMLVHIDLIVRLLYKHLRISIILLLFLLFLIYHSISFIEHFFYRSVALLSYFTAEKIFSLIPAIIKQGEIVTRFYNRADSMMNIYIFFSLFILFIMTFVALIMRIKKRSPILRLRILFFVLLTSLFVFIPQTVPTAGLASLLTYDRIAYRFSYSTTVFLAIPVALTYIFLYLNFKNIRLYNIGYLVIIIGLFFYSKYYSTSQNYFKNLYSFYYIFSKDKMRFNLNEKEIARIGKEIKNYHLQYHGRKPILFYARDDIAFVLKFIYGENVFYHRRGSFDFRKDYNQHHDNHTTPILFKTPEGISPYHRYR